MLHFVFTFLAFDVFLLGYSFYGEIHLLFHMFLVHCLLIYIYEFFIDIYFYCVLFEIKKLCLLVLFPHMRLYILFSVSGNI